MSIFEKDCCTILLPSNGSGNNGNGGKPDLGTTNTIELYYGGNNSKTIYGKLRYYDSSSIDFLETGLGFSAKVKLSPSAGNIITDTPQGLKATYILNTVRFNTITRELEIYNNINNLWTPFKLSYNDLSDAVAKFTEVDNKINNLEETIDLISIGVKTITTQTTLGEIEDYISQGYSVFRATENGTYANGLAVENIDFTTHRVEMYNVGGVWSMQVILSTVSDTKIAEINSTYGSVNRIVAADLIHNYYIDQSNGNVGSVVGYNVTDYIPLVVGYRVKLNPAIYQQFALYDANKMFVPSIFSSNGTLDFLPPSTSKYIRLTVQDGQESTAYLYNYPVKLEGVTAADINSIINADNDKNFIPDTLVSSTYVDQENGNIGSVGGFNTTDKIDISSSDYWQVNPNIYQQYAFYNASNAFVADTQSSLSKHILKRPATAKFINLTVKEEDKTTAFLKKVVGVNSLRIANRVIEVGKMTGDFTTIQAAIDYAELQSEACTIRVMPGLYLENLKLKGGKTKIIGTNPRDCIIQTNTGNYYLPPLETSGNVYFEGLTFRATDTAWSSPSIMAYAVHGDFNGSGRTEFFNCVLESNVNSAIGIGTWQSQTFVLRNCTLRKLDVGRPYNGGALYFHNRDANGVTNQRLEVINCLIETDTGVALKIDDSNQLFADGLNRDTTVLFIGNTFYSKEKGTTDIFYRAENSRCAGCLVGNIKLDPRSHGNNIADLNAI